MQLVYWLESCQMCSCGLSTALMVDLESLLQVNLQLISSQSLKLPAEAVSKLLDGCSHFASLRLHPSRVVTGSHVEWGSFCCYPAALLFSMFFV